MREPLHCQPVMQNGTAPKRAEREEPLCRVCGIHLLSKAEAAIGVHVRCVQNVEKRRVKATIPRPRYGNITPPRL